MRASALGLVLFLLVQCDAPKRQQEQPAGPSAATTTAAKADPPCASMPCPAVGIAECDSYLAQATACFQKGEPSILQVRMRLLAGIRNIWVDQARGWTPERGGERDLAKARANAQDACKDMLAQATKTGTFVCEQ
jgi:hypothetical protein